MKIRNGNTEFLVKNQKGYFAYLRYNLQKGHPKIQESTYKWPCDFVLHIQHLSHKLLTHKDFHISLCNIWDCLGIQNLLHILDVVELKIDSYDFWKIWQHWVIKYLRLLLPGIPSAQLRDCASTGPTVGKAKAKERPNKTKQITIFI